MMTERLNELADRLAEHERSRRQQFWSLALMIGGLAVVGGLGFLHGNREIEAERFILRDRAGVVRLELALETDGNPRVELKDARGQRQLILHGSAQSGAHFQILDRGSPRVDLWTGGDGSSGFQMYDRKSRGLVTMYLQNDGTCGFGACNRELAMEFAAQPDGLGGLGIINRDGQQSARWGLLPDWAHYRSFNRSSNQKPFGPRHSARTSAHASGPPESLIPGRGSHGSFPVPAAPRTDASATDWIL